MEMTLSEKILFLGSERSPVYLWLREQHEPVTQTAEKVSPELVRQEGWTFLVSHGYRYILKHEILSLFPDKAVNLHISLLPWNRGADPNFWSFVEDTPKGVTIHFLDDGVDTGDIIAQQELRFDAADETLATSYETLQSAIVALFRHHWPDIKRGTCLRRKQEGPGTSHKTKDKEPLFLTLKEGWNTPVAQLEKLTAK